jgi:hypothetical protein
MYREISNPLTNEVICILRTADNSYIPTNEANSDYQVYLAWLAEGNTPLPPDEVQA